MDDRLSYLKSSSASIRSAYTLFSTTSDQLSVHRTLAGTLEHFGDALSFISICPIEYILNNDDCRNSLRDALSVVSVAISAPGSLSPLLRSNPTIDAIRTANAYKIAAESIFMSLLSKCFSSGHAMAIFRILQLKRTSDGAGDISGLGHLEKILWTCYRLLKPLQPLLLSTLTDTALSIGSQSFIDTFKKSSSLTFGISSGPTYTQDVSNMIATLQKGLEALISQSLYEMTLVKEFPKGFSPQPETVLSASSADGIDDIGILRNDTLEIFGNSSTLALSITGLLRLHDAAMNRGGQSPVLSSTTLQNVWICLPHAMPTTICERQYENKEIERKFTKALYTAWLEDSADLTSTLTPLHQEDGHLSSTIVSHKRHYVPLAFSALTRLVSQFVSSCDTLCPSSPSVPLSRFSLDSILFTSIMESKFPITGITNPIWTESLFVYPQSIHQTQPSLSKPLIKAITISRFFFRVAAKTLAPLVSLSLHSGTKVHPAVKEILSSVISNVRSIFYLSFAPVTRLGSQLQDECRRGDTALSEIAWLALKPLLLTVSVNSGQESSGIDSELCAEMTWEILLQFLSDSIHVKRVSSSTTTSTSQCIGSLLLSLRILSDMFSIDYQYSSHQKTPQQQFSRVTDDGLLSLLSLIPVLYEASRSDIQMSDDLHKAHAAFL
jgi:hypothetical protein